MSKWTFLLFSYFLVGSIQAQTVSGRVIDDQKQAIPEAYILNKNTKQYAFTDEWGRFQLEGSAVGDSLDIVSLGFELGNWIIRDVQEVVLISLTPKPVALGEVTISPGLDALHVITDIDIQTNPVNTSQDILRRVPGLFIGQHAGGGKAEQIFLRGFDIDHGTDVNITVDGLPVNMVSHAHGQGYADLHFLIPEVIENIDFGKGPYYQDQGNFATAGYVDFRTRERLDHSSLKLEVGQFDSYRVLGMLDLISSDRHSAYVATEYSATDGFFESSQNFDRLNIMGKYSGQLTNRDRLGVTLSHFDSKWDASGQIPQRAVDDGTITRFGAIDDTEGGETSRTNVAIDYDKIIDDRSSLSSTLYFVDYNFELYSNFTFFLEDPERGDQIRQKEDRTILGFNTEYNRSYDLGELDGIWRAGLSLRNDRADDVELSKTANRRETLENIQLGDINETNVGAYVGTTLEYKRWTFNPSLRFDYFDFQYNDQLLGSYLTQAHSEAIVNPKLNVLYNPSRKSQVYLKMGRGFHSNDTRVIVSQDRDILPAAYGFDVGYIWKPRHDMLLNVAYWYLFLEQEFVYVGDAGIVEPSGRTRRQGVDFSFRYQPLTWLFWNVDANYTYARAIDESEGNDFIPLAPDFTLVSGLNLQFDSGIFGSVNVRHLADRPANEDNSIVAEGFTVTDVNAGYKWNRTTFGVQVQNVFDVDWNETQFATESRLADEAEPVEEIHFTPGTPFFLRASIQYDF